MQYVTDAVALTTKQKTNPGLIGICFAKHV